MILPTQPLAGFTARRDTLLEVIAGFIDRGRYVLDDEVRSFEREFAAFLGASAAVGVASGTDAIQLGLRACGIGPGDEVLTVSHTAVGTVAGIEACGAEAVFVDVDSRSGNINPDLVRQCLTEHTRIKALVPVHLYGRPADMRRLCRLADEFGLRVVEDCAQAHGATLDGRCVGTWGDAGAFSFYPTKNLPALGDGGAVVTDDPAIEQRLRSLREYGWRERYVSFEPGLNSRLDELQAAVLRIRLRGLNEDNARRQRIARKYDALLPPRIDRFEAPEGAECVYHQYVIKTPERNALRAYLRDNGVETLVHYPKPVHLQPAYQGRVAHGTVLSKSEALADSVLSLPIFPELDLTSVETVANLIGCFDRAAG